jgi:rhodanese-related sulfurtransferase
VRTPKEYEAGHLADAVLLEFHAADFAQRLGQLDRGKSYLVHCESGGRSTLAVEEMEALGFTSIYHLDGGMSAWEEAGLPVVK